MPPRVLLSTTSYQDTPGEHHSLLESSGFDIHRERGPLGEEEMLELAAGGGFDALLCGDDALNRGVLDALRPRLRVISKYGIGLDKIDLAACDEFGVPVLFTPGVNHTTVAEHTFALLLALVKDVVGHAVSVRSGAWERHTGNEIWRKKVGVIGLGRIGEEFIRRARGFDMEVHAFGRSYWPAEFCDAHQVTRHDTVEGLAAAVDILSLHTKLTSATHRLVDAALLGRMKDGAVLLNTSRGELVDNAAVIAALDSGKLAGYAADVLDQEPPPPDHPLTQHPKTLITPHIGSRTYESVPRQAMKATRNLINYLNGEGDVHQANAVPLPEGSGVNLV